MKVRMFDMFAPWWFVREWTIQHDSDADAVLAVPQGGGTQTEWHHSDRLSEQYMFRDNGVTALGVATGAPVERVVYIPAPRVQFATLPILKLELRRLVDESHVLPMYKCIRWLRSHAERANDTTVDIAFRLSPKADGGFSRRELTMLCTLSKWLKKRDEDLVAIGSHPHQKQYLRAIAERMRKCPPPLVGASAKAA